MALRIASNRVSFAKLRPQLLLAIMAAEIAFREEGADCFVTSGDDGVHSRQSLHDDGLAVDLRTHHIPWATAEKIAAKLKRDLSPMFDVVLETTIPGKRTQHLHIEYNPK